MSVACDFLRTHTFKASLLWNTSLCSSFVCTVWECQILTFPKCPDQRHPGTGKTWVELVKVVLNHDDNVNHTEWKKQSWNSDQIFVYFLASLLVSMLTRYHGMLIQNIINLLSVGQRVPKPKDFSISVSFILYFVANFNIFQCLSK